MRNRSWTKLLALALTAVMTIVVTMLRVIWMPTLLNERTGMFGLSYVVILLMAVTVLAVFVLTFRSARQPRPVQGGLLLPTALMAMLCGASLLLFSALDAWRWFTTGTTPPPNEQLISTLDGVVLLLVLVFGILGGVFLVRVGLGWIADNTSRTGVLRLWALKPVLWMWMRLARYEMSYASAVDVSQSFYDFVMLIFTLLFFFALARYVSGIFEKPPRMLLFYALGTAFFSLSGTVARFVLYLQGDTAAYNASQLAGFADLLVGLFALFFALTQCLARESDFPTEPKTEEELLPSSDAADTDGRSSAMEKGIDAL